MICCLMSGGGEGCPVTRAWRVIGKPWRLVVVERLLERPMSFNEIMSTLEGISTRTLSRILKELTELGVVESYTTAGGRRRYYKLTKMGQELKPIINDLRSWGEKWLK